MPGLLEKLGVRKATPSLTQQIERVSGAWRDLAEHSGPGYEANRSWVMEVYPDHVIVCHGEDYYSVPYTEAVDSGEVAFDVEAATPVERTWSDVEKRVRIEKIDEDEQVVFGWAYVSEADGSPVEDHSGEWIAKEDLEAAAYAFNLSSRLADERHDWSAAGQLVESFVSTPEKLEALGLSKDALPTGWWVGFHIDDADAWEKVRTGEYRMLSIGGRAHKHVEEVAA